MFKIIIAWSLISFIGPNLILYNNFYFNDNTGNLYFVKMNMNDPAFKIFDKKFSFNFCNRL